MHLFTGMSTTDYQDVLRAIGTFADERGWRYLRFQEMDDGILLQGVETRDHGHLGVRHMSHVFTDEDLRAILAAAYRRRQGGLHTSGTVGSEARRPA